MSFLKTGTVKATLHFGIEMNLYPHFLQLSDLSEGPCNRSQHNAVEHLFHENQCRRRAYFSYVHIRNFTYASNIKPGI
jgi:hypothetical protein